MVSRKQSQLVRYWIWHAGPANDLQMLLVILKSTGALKFVVGRLHCTVAIAGAQLSWAEVRGICEQSSLYLYTSIKRTKNTHLLSRKLGSFSRASLPHLLSATSKCDVPDRNSVDRPRAGAPYVWARRYRQVKYPSCALGEPYTACSTASRSPCE